MFLSAQSLSEPQKEKRRVVAQKIINDKNETLTLKGLNGGPMKSIKLSEFRTKVLFLKKHIHIPIKELSKYPEVEKIYIEIHGLINLLQEAAKYDIVEKIIRDCFRDVRKTKTGTIGCVFAGCNVETNFNGNPKCTPFCAGSVHSGSGGYCSKLVLVYGGKNKFVQYNKPDSNSQAYIHIENRYSFSGFTKEEIQKLKELGVKKCKIVRYSESSKHFDDSGCPDFISIDDVPKSSGSSDSSNVGALIIFIFILILLLVCMWFYSRQGRRRQFYR